MEKPRFNSYIFDQKDYEHVCKVYAIHEELVSALQECLDVIQGEFGDYSSRDVVNDYCGTSHEEQVKAKQLIARAKGNL